jgi:hypothetical protein
MPFSERRTSRRNCEVEPSLKATFLPLRSVIEPISLVETMPSPPAEVSAPVMIRYSSPLLR